MKKIKTYRNPVALANWKLNKQKIVPDKKKLLSKNWCRSNND